MKWFLACIILLSLGGCALVPDRKIAQLSLQKKNYFYIYENDQERCYARVEAGTLQDQVCTKGDYLRYTSEPPEESHNLTVPSTVLAIFDEHGFNQSEKPSLSPKP